MAIYVYNTTTGALVSWCPNDTDPVAPADTLAANGLASVSGLPALGPTVAWDDVNKTTRSVYPQPTDDARAAVAANTLLIAQRRAAQLNAKGKTFEAISAMLGAKQ